MVRRLRSFTFVHICHHSVNCGRLLFSFLGFSFDSLSSFKQISIVLTAILTKFVWAASAKFALMGFRINSKKAVPYVFDCKLNFKEFFHHLCGLGYITGSLILYHRNPNVLSITFSAKFFFAFSHLLRMFHVNKCFVFSIFLSVSQIRSTFDQTRCQE